METLYFTGNCPQCLLLNKYNRMYYNIENDLECPSCNLRVYYDNSNTAIVYRKRGSNDFDLKIPPRIYNHVILTQTDSKYDNYTNGVVLNTRNGLIEYLAQINNNATNNILVVLVEAYIDSFYNNNNDEFYKMISQLIDIDLSQFKCINSFQTLNFKYLHFLINQYKNDDILKVQSQTQHPELKKLVNDIIISKREILKTDAFLQKTAMMNLIIHQIQILYKEKSLLNAK